MITLHMIGNAHLDPVWRWRRAEYRLKQAAHPMRAFPEHVGEGMQQALDQAWYDVHHGTMNRSARCRRSENDRGT